jgi:hypothetical protein
MATKVWQLRQQPQGTVYCIEKSPTVLGRNSDCDLVIEHSSISHQHVQFNVEGRTLVIHDLNSTNGTFFNGRRIKTVKLKSSGRNPETLKLGDLVFDIAHQAPTFEPQPVHATAGNQDDLAEWFFASNGTEHGPLTLAQVYEAVDRGELRPTDDFWQDGMSYRCKAFEVEGLFTSRTEETEPGIQEVARLSSGMPICPYCWNRFQPEEILFVASHPDLLGDPVLGADELQRFLPTRFTPEGLAIDAGGIVSPDMACPTCHMRLPASVTNQPPLFMSIVGAPGSGKSYFLASAVWRMRTTLPKLFGIRFMDVDAVTNQWLNDYEEKLFFQVDAEGYQTIAKTDLQAPSVYRQIKLNNMAVSLPLPSLFSLHANSDFEARPDLSANRTLVLYDNAGEHFQAGGDSAAAPGTKHLVHAEGILFLFDPTEDPRFRAVLSRGTSSMPFSTKSHRQDVLLIEMIGRIRKYLGMSSSTRIRKTVIVGISKADLLSDLLPFDGEPWRFLPGRKDAVLDMQVITRMSAAVRSLMDKFAPEIVATVESFAESVLYVPNSALGHHPSKEGVRPCDIKPRWVEVPLLYVLSRLGYVQVVGEVREP